MLDAAAFGRVFKKANRSRDKLFTVLCRDNDAEIARLGLAISKKNCRAATARNRIKRIIRESFREHQAILSGLDVVRMNKIEKWPGQQHVVVIAKDPGKIGVDPPKKSIQPGNAKKVV